MTPAPPDRLDRFAREVARAVDQVGYDDVQVACAAEHTAGFRFSAVPTTANAAAPLDQVLAGAPVRAALVTKVGWAPDAVAPVRPAWAIVAVQSGRPALCAVRRVAEDRHWTEIEPGSMPWLLLSSAAGLRDALENGEPLRLKVTADPRMFHRPDQEPAPPVDERGDL